MVAGLNKITISAEHVVPWDRSRISAQLIRESQLATEYFGIPALTTEEAEDIAFAVEETISQIAPPVLTAPMVREFVNVELIKRGHLGIRAITTRIGMSVADAIEIDRGFGFEAKENANLQENAETGHKKKADKISKEQYLLLLPPHLSNRHLLGDYHIHDLEYFGTRPFCIPNTEMVMVRKSGKVLVVPPSACREGDELWTPNGFRLIKFRTSRRFSGELVRIRDSRGGLVEVTPEHRIPIVCKGEIKRIPAEDLAVGDKLVSVKKWERDGLEKMSSATARYIGSFLADGHYRKDKNGYYVIVSDSGEVTKNIVAEFAREREVHVGVSQVTGKAPQYIITRKSVYDELVDVGIQTGAANKCLPNVFFELPLDRQGDLIGAMFNGDGTVKYYDKNSTIAISYSTTSRTLAYQLSMWLKLNGLRHSIRIRPPSTKGFQGQHNLYLLSISGRSEELKRIRFLGDQAEEVNRYLSSCKKTRKKDRETYVEEAERIPYEGEVYDFGLKDSDEVENHLFLAGSGVYISNCQSWDLRYFFYYGLMPDGTGTKASVAGPAMNAEVAILHAVKVLASAQTNWAGGQGLMDFLTFISPYLEGLGYKEIKQLMQMLVYELTQAYVARGGQLCFTSVQLTPGVPKLWRDRPCVYRGRLWDGKHQAERRVYGEFEREVRLAFKAVMEVMIAGDFWGKPFSFPKPEISIAPEFIDEEVRDSPLYDGDVKIAPSYRELYTLAFTLAATQGTPYFDNTVPPFRQTGGIECYQSIPGDTLVATKSSDGVKLKAIEKVLSGDVLLTPKGFETFESMLKYKTDRNILQLTLANGRGIQCTPEHEMPVIRGGEDLRLRASDIREGDRLKISTWLPNDGGLPRHEKANEEGNDVELAYLMGLYVAEGYMLVRDRPKGGRIQFSFGEENLANRCKVLLENLFGATVKLQHLENEYRVMVYNLALCKYFQDVLHLPKKTGSEGRIPDHIFAARDELKWAFLLGYIQGDGCLRETHKGNGFWRLSIETASKELAEGFVLLTSSLGYNFSIREKASRPGMMSLTLTRQKELKKFLALQPGGFDGALRVKAIQPRHYQGMVYDPVEVQNHDFVLGNGIVSGNCCAFTFQVLDSKESFEDKMNFVGGAHFSPGGNQVITLNTVRYAMLAHGDVQAFEDVVKQALEDVGEVFQIKKKWLDVQISNGRIPFMTQRPKDPARVRGTGMGITLGGAAPPAIDREEQVYAIGLVGINETVQALTGEELHESREAWKMGVFIVARIAKMVQDLGERLGLPIVLARTPAETVAQRFAVADLQHQDKSVRDQARKIVKGDVDRALELIAEGKTDLPVYQTNGAMISNQAMNGAEAVSLFKKAEIEGVFFPLFAGGDIFHIFLKEANPSPAGLMDFAFKLATNTNIGYFTFTRDMTVCKHCSKVASGLKLECPFCGSDKVEWLSRVTGYIQSVSSFNEAKKQELKDRTRYGEEEL